MNKRKDFLFADFSLIVVLLLTIQENFIVISIFVGVFLYLIFDIIKEHDKDRILRNLSENEPKKNIIELIQTNIDELDPLFDEAARAVVNNQNGSTCFLIQTLSIRFLRASRLGDQMERAGIIGPNRGYNKRDVLINNLNYLDANLGELKNFARKNRWLGWTIKESRYIAAHIDEWRTIIKSEIFPIPGYLDPMVVDVAIYVVGNQYCDCKDIESKYSVGHYRAEIYIEVLEKLEVVKRNSPTKNEVLVKDIYGLSRIFNYYLVPMTSNN